MVEGALRDAETFGCLRWDHEASLHCLRDDLDLDRCDGGYGCGSGRDELSVDNEGTCDLGVPMTVNVEDSWCWIAASAQAPRESCAVKDIYLPWCMYKERRRRWILIFSFVLGESQMKGRRGK
jgi:hypothetical protein